MARYSRCIIIQVMKNKKGLPVVSFILLTYNGGSGVRDILNSIKRQSYPKKLIDVVVVDDGSTDDSVKITREYRSRVFVRPGGGSYTNWVFGLHKTKGDFVYYVEQDMELRGTDFIQKMLKPLLREPDLMASFTREGYPVKNQPWISRYLSYHPSQCDPLYEFITPPLEKTFVKRKKGYVICKFTVANLPPFARMFYRIEYLKKTPNWKVDQYFDHDFMTQCIKSSYNLFAYVPAAGLYHHHASSLGHLLSKRVRNLRMHYFPYNNETEYKWINVNNKKDILKMIFWIIYANMFLPATIRGFLRFLKYKDPVLLMEPIVTIAITDVLLVEFLKNRVGRSMINNSVRTLFGTNLE